MFLLSTSAGRTTRLPSPLRSLAPRAAFLAALPEAAQAQGPDTIRVRNGFVFPVRKDGGIRHIGSKA